MPISFWILVLGDVTIGADFTPVSRDRQITKSLCTRRYKVKRFRIPPPKIHSRISGSWTSNSQTQNKKLRIVFNNFALIFCIVLFLSFSYFSFHLTTGLSKALPSRLHSNMFNRHGSRTVASLIQPCNASNWHGLLPFCGACTLFILIFFTYRTYLEKKKQF
jgi:hypothetical protein